MSGWIAVSRGLLGHSFFAPEPLTEREAWLWLICNAAWKDTRHTVGGDAVEVKRGSLFQTLRGLSVEWKWRTDKRVRTFLDRLEKHGMIARKTVGSRRNSKTHITICNYDHYQIAGRNSDGIADAKLDAKTDAKWTQATTCNHSENNDRGRKVDAKTDAKTDAVKEQKITIPTTSGGSEIDPAKVIFNQCLGVLKSAGVPDAKARSVLGKWRKANGDEAVIAAVGKCQREGAVDPVAYVEGVFRFQKKQGRDSDDRLSAWGIKDHDAENKRNFSRGGDSGSPPLRDAANGLPGMLPDPAQEVGPLPERDVQAGRGRLELLALRA